MANYTIKAYLQKQAVNKLGMMPVSLCYYDGKQHAFPLRESVKAKDWNDKGQGSFRSSAPDASVKNEKLKLYISLLDQVASNFAEFGWTRVRTEFERVLALLRHELLNQEAHKTKRNEKAQQLSGQVEEAIARKQQELDLLGVQREMIARSYSDVVVPKIVQTEEEVAAYDLFHEQAKHYIKRFRGKEGRVCKHQVTFKDGEVLSLDMDVPAHSWYKVLLEFEEYSGYRCTFANIDRVFYNKYTDYLWDVKDYEDASHFNHASRLRMFMADSLSLGYPVNLFYKHTSFKLYKQAKPILALTEAELEDLWQTEFSKKKLNKVRDKFCFQAFTGLRVSDSQRENEVRNERVVGVLKTQKTKGNYSIPLSLYRDDRLQQLLARNLKMDRNPYRLGIKEMMKEFFTKRGQAARTVNVYKYKRGVLLLDAKGELPVEPIWEAFSSHNARKTFCTIMFLKDYTVEMVAKMIGSKRQDVLRDNYISFIDSDLDKKIKNIEDAKAMREKLARQEQELAELRRMLPPAPEK